MAGNTRGKLKEHFEGIHRNFDWSIHHINQALALIESQLKQTSSFIQLNNDEEAIKKAVEAYPLYQGIKSLGDGIQTLDDLAQAVYEKI